MSARTPLIAVVGAGAIGCRLAAHLAGAGTDCLLFDGWAAHVDTINREGLQLAFNGQLQRYAFKAFGYGDPEEYSQAIGRCDIVLLCTRSDDTAAVLPLVNRLLNANGCVVSCQNGLNEDLIAEAVGAGRTLGCSLVFGAKLIAPGHVTALPGEDTLRTGELAGGTSERLDHIVQLLSACGTSTATPNLIGYRWMKLVLNSIGNPLLLLSGMTAAELHALPVARSLMISLAREVLHTARVSGLNVYPVLGLNANVWLDESAQATQAVHAALAQHGAALGPRRLSMVADFEARGKTEVDFINGYVVRKARQHELTAPLNAAVVVSVRQLEAGECAIGVDRLRQLASMT